MRLKLHAGAKTLKHLQEKSWKGVLSLKHESQKTPPPPHKSGVVSNQNPLYPFVPAFAVIRNQPREKGLRKFNSALKFMLSARAQNPDRVPETKMPFGEAVPDWADGGYAIKGG
ncbi:hypothetical protein CHS0354_002095 [Potamilus streckersoni]|uniref:Uncharacterized protein n=1 Tax=Potamilus streckersoni TaxID=2493646 RepID=A0AAE0T5M9_9BIVA|nr:hypothetical protein CHS0354_002095 [Potamilus streckersoni]